MKRLSGLMFAIVLCLMFSLAAEDTGKTVKDLTKNSAAFNPARTNSVTDVFSKMGRALVLYFPNRLLDINDIFSMQVGVGGYFEADAKLTEYMQFGGWHGNSYFLAKGYDRQFGGGYGRGTKFGMLFLTTEKVVVEEPFGTVREYELNTNGFGPAGFEFDAYRDNDTDFWAIGGGAGWLANIRVFVHPVELGDLIAGLFFVDLKGDDLK